MGIHYLEMRIGFDIRPFLREETGVGIYFRNLLFSLAKIDKSNEYFLFSSSLKDRFDPKKIPPFNKKHFREFFYPVKVINFFWQRLGWPHLDCFFKTRLDLTHSPTPLPLPTKGKKIVTVYDLFFLDFPMLADSQARRNFAQRMKRAMQKADGVVTISRFTAQQLKERFGVEEKRIKVVYPGIDRRFWENVEQKRLEQTKADYHLPSDFLLFVGASERRKNLLNLLKALKIVHARDKKIMLLLIGPKGQDHENVRKKIQELGLDSWVKMIGYLDDNELKNFYRLASALVYPSWWEGFGIPLLEAMACGIPVVTSRTSALPEAGGEAAVYSDPKSPEDIAEKILMVLEDHSLREKLIAAGKKQIHSFGWERAASHVLCFYECIMEQ
jgi:glycosyltransferase involved in cell wall biosynthesis